MSERAATGPATGQRPATREGRPGPKRFLHDNALGLLFGALFLAAMAGQALAGWLRHNQEQQLNGLQDVPLWSYIFSSDFGVDLIENWQSEYLQFLLYILATAWLVQRGSPESKQPEERGLGDDEKERIGPYADERSPKWARVGGLRTRVYAWSLSLVMGAIFLGCWLVQSLTGQVAFNEQRLADLQGPVGWSSYVTSAEFWNRTLQNWQSEFLAVASLAVFGVFLRQRGSPESKPVGAAHEDTGSGD